MIRRRNKVGLPIKLPIPTRVTKLIGDDDILQLIAIKWDEMPNGYSGCQYLVGYIRGFLSVELKIGTDRRARHIRAILSILMNIQKRLH